MTQAQQSEAQRLAAICETKGMFPVADELNRMHARILELEQGKCAEPAAAPQSALVEALRAVCTDMVAVGNGQHAITDAARDKVEALQGVIFSAAPQAVQPAIMPKGESAATQLRAMATNYPAGHNWDKLDARACIRGALEIEALRALLAAAPAHPAEGVPTSSDLRERLARLEAGCNAHTTPTVYEAIADSKAALDELDEARQRVGISLAATQPAAQRDELLQVVLNFIDTLTATPQQIDMPPSNFWKVFYDFADRVNAITVAQPAAQGLEQDAERWGEVLRHVGAAPHFGGQHFTLNTLQAPVTALGFKANLMSGSVAQHFTKAIDAERAAQAKQGGA